MFLNICSLISGNFEFPSSNFGFQILDFGFRLSDILFLFIDFRWHNPGMIHIWPGTPLILATLVWFLFLTIRYGNQISYYTTSKNLIQRLERDRHGSWIVETDNFLTFSCRFLHPNWFVTIGILKIRIVESSNNKFKK